MTPLNTSTISEGSRHSGGLNSLIINTFNNAQIGVHSPRHSCSSSCSSCTDSSCKKSDFGSEVDLFDEPFGQDPEQDFESEAVSPNCDCSECQSGTPCQQELDVNSSTPLRLKNIDALLRQIDEQVYKLKCKQAATANQQNTGETTGLLQDIPEPQYATLESPGEYSVAGALSISIPSSFKDAENLPPYSSPPPPIREPSARRTNSPPCKYSAYPMSGTSPVYRDLPGPPSYDSILESVSPASTLQCSPRRADYSDSSIPRRTPVESPVPYRGAQQLSPQIEHKRLLNPLTDRPYIDPSPVDPLTVCSLSGSSTNSLYSNPFKNLEHMAPLKQSQEMEYGKPPEDYSPLFGVKTKTPTSAAKQMPHPVLDSYLSAQSPGTNSTSEGYHSDRLEQEEPVIVREIPRLKSPSSSAKPLDFTTRPKSSVDL